MSLIYHQKTLDLLNLAPVYDPQARAHLDKLETTHGKKLPASVREWYEIIDAAQHLTGNDNPVPVEKLSSKLLENQRGVTDTLVIVVDENQYVLSWAFQWDDSDDPPVWVKFNEEKAHWQLYSPTFTEFVYTRVWDWLEKPFWILAYDSPYTPDLHNALQQRYTPEPTSYHYFDDYTIVYRFSAASVGQIMAWIDNRQEAQWFFKADTEQMLSELVCFAWRTKATDYDFEIWRMPDENEEKIMERLYEALQSRPPNL